MFMLARVRSGQKWPESCIQGAFISARGRNGQRSMWPEVEVARGQSGQRTKWPGDEVARARSGQSSKWPWPGVEVTRGAVIGWVRLCYVRLGKVRLLSQSQYLWPLRPLAISSSGTYECTLYAAF